MPNVDERLGKVEHGLQGVEERLGKVEVRLDRVEVRLDTVDKRLETVDRRLDELTGQVDMLTGRVDMLTGRVDMLTEEVQKLRVLGEENTRQIKLVAEVQSHHGTILNKLVKDIEPLTALPGLLQHVIQDHERRISALENRASSS